MKKLLSLMVTIAIIATIALLPAEGYSKPKWRLYDDFDYANGPPDPDRWTINNPGDASIYIEGKKAKFEITGENPWTPNFLIINMEPEQLQEIKGIRATVSVVGTQADVGGIQGGIGAIIGKLPFEVFYLGNYYAGYVWDGLYIQAGYQTINCGLPVVIYVPGPYSPFNIFEGKFGVFPPDYLLDIDITITMMFSEKKMKYEGSEGGKITRELGIKLDPIDPRDPSEDDRHFRGLATWNGEAGDTAEVYFDDVYILK